MNASTPVSSPRLTLSLPRDQAALLVDRLRLAIGDGYDQDGLLADLRRQAKAAVEGRDLRTRGTCKECGRSFTEVPAVDHCPWRRDRYLGSETAGGGVS